jgi:hypothetical protein
LYYLRNIEIVEARIKSGLPLKTIERYQYRTAAWPQSEEERAKARQLCGEGPDYAAWFQQSVELRSEHDEDKFIYEKFFKKKMLSGDGRTSHRDFVYVELGGFDGLRASNTRFFDVCLGWQGALVEANPMIFPQLKRNRKNAHRMSFAATCPDGDQLSNSTQRTVEYFKVKWSNAAQVPGVQSMYHSLPATRRVQVPCGSLTPVLSTLFPQNEPIHFMSVDVSGAEYLFVENFDFAAVPVEIVLIKWFHPDFCQHDCDNRRRVHQVMTTGAGYERAMAGFSRKYDLYIRPDSPYRNVLRP